ncbi:hypothetical protein D3C86_2173370 [compost metagenome]
MGEGCAAGGSEIVSNHHSRHAKQNEGAKQHEDEGEAAKRLQSFLHTVSPFIAFILEYHTRQVFLNFHPAGKM